MAASEANSKFSLTQYLKS